MNTPLLSVCLITYNHENFIREAIDGVLMQKVDFDWELIIAEDCSTDRTREIVLEYKERYPDFIKLILQEKNVGPATNWLDLITTPKSRYIAYFEGDDYWTDPLKLQKQVDFLEENEDYSIAWSKYSKVDYKGDQIEKNLPIFDESLVDVTVDNFFENYRTWTLTCVFRTSVFEKHDFSKFKYSKDNTLFFAAIYNSKGRVLDFNSACYRIHDSGIWSSSTNVNRCLADFNNYNEIKNKIVYTSSLDFIVKRNLKDIVQSLIGYENNKMVDMIVFNKIFFPVLIKLPMIDKMKFLKWYFIKLRNFLNQ
jgi:glycosyltransferase involved in cell wall biosynthesis